MIHWQLVIVIEIARNSRENGSTDINVNFWSWSEGLISLGKNMCSIGTCYLDKLEHRIAHKWCSSWLVYEAQETWFLGFIILLFQSANLVKCYYLWTVLWIGMTQIWCLSVGPRDLSPSPQYANIYIKRERIRSFETGINKYSKGLKDHTSYTS